MKIALMNYRADVIELGRAALRLSPTGAVGGFIPESSREKISKIQGRMSLYCPGMPGGFAKIQAKKI